MELCLPGDLVKSGVRMGVMFVTSCNGLVNGAGRKQKQKQQRLEHKNRIRGRSQRQAAGDRRKRRAAG